MPAGCRAIFVTDQLADKYADWQPVFPSEARAVLTDDPLVLDVETRYSGRYFNGSAQPEGLLTIQADDHLSRHELEQIATRWKEVAHDLPVIVLDGGIELVELTDEELAKMGLRRA